MKSFYYICTQMKNKEGVLRSMRVPVGLVDVAAKEGWLRSLGYWMMAKNTFRNSSIYEFSVVKLSKVMDCSYHCAKTHYNVWLKQGLVRTLKNGTLQFCGLKEMGLVGSRSEENSYYKLIRINMFSNIREQLMCLESRAVLKYINKQAFSLIKKCEVLKNLKLVEKKRLTSSEYKKWKYAKSIVENKFGGNINTILESFNKNICLSNDKIAELVGCSLSYANNLKKFFNYAGILTTSILKGDRMSNTKISKEAYYIARETNPCYDNTFLYRGYVYECPKTKYSLGYAVSPVLLTMLESIGKV